MIIPKKKLIDLDECVLRALELFSKTTVPALKITFKHPLVVGSGNAAVTGKILFQDRDAVFADEGTYVQKLKTIKRIDGAVLISASGGKHAPIIAKDLRKRKIKTVLLTNNKNAAAAEYADKVYVFPKQPEPYTYNTSTYMGMILAKTKEDPKKILKFLQKFKKKIPHHLHNYTAFFLIVPSEFDLLREMFVTKFNELFGAKVSGRVCTPEQTKHAKTVVPSDRELFISFGYKNKLFGKHRLNLPLPPHAYYAAMMAAGYYVIGHIQKQHPPYFKENIERYVKETSKVFGEKIKVIVE